jgi:phosphatidylinositol 4-phosphatase
LVALAHEKVVMGKGRILKTYDSRAIFENLETGNCLVITQIKDGWPSKDIQVIERNQLAECTGQFLTLSIEAIYGFYDLLSGPYVAVVIESENFISTNGFDIRKALKIVIIPLFRQTRFLSESKQKDEDQYLQLLHLSFTKHQFFFSYHSDLTSTQQRKATKYSSSSSSSSSSSLLSSQRLSHNDPLWSRANYKFFWNRDLILDLISSSADEWIIPFISAYIEFRPGCEIDNDRFAILFISRRSKMRQGCRFTKRGIDENGYVANYVETEQILLFPDGKITSFVQIRGSIPVVWSSPVHMKWDPVVLIEEDRIKSAEYCHKHILDINYDCAPPPFSTTPTISTTSTTTPSTSDNYNTSAGVTSSTTIGHLNQLVFVNLIDNKKDQGRLGVEFKEILDMVRGNTPIQLKYIWFDFHHETKQKGKWQNLSKLVKLIDASSSSSTSSSSASSTSSSSGLSFFCRLPSGEITSWQTSLLRTNCMDNLDRTNVVQSIFARRSLLLQLNRHDLLNSSNTSHILEIPFKKFEVIYKTLWANNANEMSMLYAGTGALKVDFTKTGKRTYTGMVNDGVNASMRYYINNFLDGSKQDGIDLMLGLFKPDPLGPSPFQMREGQETVTENINKAFVLMVLIFTLLLIFSPHLFLLIGLNTKLALVDGDGVDEVRVGMAGSVLTHKQVIIYQLLLSIGLSCLFVMYIVYLMLKKGTKLGEKLVVHPVLVPDTMISAQKNTAPAVGKKAN